ncbi:50S ribosomal protein L10 [Candidatus Woesearchaeota archaeon]|nr:50S ribosomal protein L10 [Candidatus Woesearchaeota archaeon]
MINYKPHVSEVKEATVKQLVKQLDEAPIIGILNMESLPAKNLARMRKSLRDKVEIVMAKRRLIKIALGKSKKQGIDQLDPYLTGMPALLFTKDNPFTLFKIIKKNQSPAPIKAGQEAPKDLVIPAGPTQFPPGPIIGELGGMGIKAGIQDGKVVIKEDATILKEGELADVEKAGFCAKMGMEPMRIGLTLTAVFENGEILTSKVLDIDEDKFMQDIATAASQASNLAYEIMYTTSDNIIMFIQKAHVEAENLSYEAEVLTDSNTSRLLAKADAQAATLKSKVPDAPVKEKPKETPEEKPAEPTEKPAEEPKTEQEEKKEETKEEPKAEEVAEKPAETEPEGEKSESQ